MIQGLQQSSSHPCAVTHSGRQQGADSTGTWALLAPICAASRTLVTSISQPFRASSSTWSSICRISRHIFLPTFLRSLFLCLFVMVLLSCSDNPPDPLDSSRKVADHAREYFKIGDRATALRILDAHQTAEPLTRTDSVGVYFYYNLLGADRWAEGRLEESVVIYDYAHPLAAALGTRYPKELLWYGSKLARVARYNDAHRVWSEAQSRALRGRQEALGLRLADSLDTLPEYEPFKEDPKTAAVPFIGWVLFFGTDAIIVMVLWVRHRRKAALSAYPFPLKAVE